MKDLEQIYDDQISPLMLQILEICQKHSMPMFAEFKYNDDGYCKSFISADWPVVNHYNAISQSKQGNGVNVDKYILWVAKQAKESGHSSMVLTQMGVPITPESGI